MSTSHQSRQSPGNQPTAVETKSFLAPRVKIQDQKLEQQSRPISSTFLHGSQSLVFYADALSNCRHPLLAGALLAHRAPPRTPASPPNPAAPGGAPNCRKRTAHPLRGGSAIRVVQPLKNIDPPRLKTHLVPQRPRPILLAKLRDKHIVPNPSRRTPTTDSRAYFDLIGFRPPEEIECLRSQQRSRGLPETSTTPAMGTTANVGPAIGLTSHAFARKPLLRTRLRPHVRLPLPRFVIQALNRDCLTHQFAAWQLACDEIAPDDRSRLCYRFLGAWSLPYIRSPRTTSRTRYDAWTT